MSRTLQPRAAPLAHQIELAHNGAALAFLIRVETVLPLKVVQEAIGASLAGPREPLVFLQLRHEGATSHAAAAHGLVASEWLAYVNTIEPVAVVAARLNALFASADWHKHEASAAACTPEEAAQAWAKLWDEIRDEVIRKDDDGAARVVPKAAEP